MNFKQWYFRNQDAITWFLIGWLSMACLNALSNGHYFSAALNAAFAYLNYKIWK